MADPTVLVQDCLVNEEIKKNCGLQPGGQVDNEVQKKWRLCSKVQNGCLVKQIKITKWQTISNK